MSCRPEITREIRKRHLRNENRCCCQLSDLFRLIQKKQLVTNLATFSGVTGDFSRHDQLLADPRRKFICSYKRANYANWCNLATSRTASSYFSYWGVDNAWWIQFLLGFSNCNTFEEDTACSGNLSSAFVSYFIAFHSINQPSTTTWTQTCIGLRVICYRDAQKDNW